MVNTYPHSQNLRLALHQLEQALAQQGNLEFLRDFGAGNALEFTLLVSKQIDAIESNKSS